MVWKLPSRENLLDMTETLYGYCFNNGNTLSFWFGCSLLLSSIWRLKVYPKITGGLFSLSSLLFWNWTLAIRLNSLVLFSCVEWTRVENYMRVWLGYCQKISPRKLKWGGSQSRMEQIPPGFTWSMLPVICLLAISAFFLPNKTIILLLKVMCHCDI